MFRRKEDINKFKFKEIIENIKIFMFNCFYGEAFFQIF